jgi:hypothetical protein
MSSITSNLYNNNLQSVLSVTADPNTTTSSLPGSTDTTSVPRTSDSSQLSPFSLAASALQYLQKTDPAKYQVVTQQIATNLQTSGKDAAADGNPIIADAFNKLSSDFSTASSTGQLPTFPDLAKLASSHPGTHHRIHATPASPTTPVDSDSSSRTDSTSTTPSTSAGSASQATNQLLASLQANQPNSLDPTNVILSTLDSAGISV